MNVIRRVAKNSVFLLLTQGVTLGAGLILSIAIARFMGVSNFGTFSFIMAFTELFIVADLGMNLLITREVSRDKSRAGKYLGNSIVLGFIFTLIALGIIALLTSAINISRTTSIGIYIAGLYVLLGCFVHFFRATFHAFEKMEYETVTVFVEKLFIIVIGLTIILRGGTLIELLLIFLIGRALNLLISSIIYLTRISCIKIEVDLKFWKHLVISAYPFGLNVLLSLIYIKIDIVLLSLIKGVQDAGLYRAASMLVVSLPVLGISLNSALFPVMSRYFKSSRDSLMSLFEKSFKFLFNISFPIAIGTIILANRLIPLMYGKAFIPSILILQILSLILPLRFANSALGVLLTSIDKQGFRTYSIGIAAIINIGLNLALIPSMSYIGASIATVLTEVLIFGLLFFYVSKFFCRIPILELTKGALMAGLILAGFTYYFQEINLFLVIGIAACFYFVSLYLFGGISQEDMAIVKRAVQKEGLST